MQTYCSACNIEYDFILKQETAMFDNEFLVKAMGLDKTHPTLHIPGRYNYSETFSSINMEAATEQKAVTIEEIAGPYKDMPKEVIEQIYLNYFP